MIYCIIGRRERGKTTLAYHMASKVPARLVFDPRRLIHRPGLRSLAISSREMLSGAVDQVLDGEADEVVYGPLEDAIEESFAAFAHECKRWIVEAPESDVALLVDEVSFVDLTQPTWQWVMRCSLRERTHVLLTGHRPVDIPTSVRSIADHWLLFQCRQEHDLKVLEVRCSPNVARTVQQLSAREFVHWDDEHGLAKRHNAPGSWYVALRPMSMRPMGAVPAYDGDTVMKESETWTLPLSQP